MTTSNFNLDSYISQYTGEAKLVRLNFIAEHEPSLAQECYERILTELENRANQPGITNTALYKKISEQANKPIAPGWIDQMNRKANQKFEQLQSNLNNVRKLYMELGEYSVYRGDYSEALKYFYRCRDYSKTPAHTQEMCMNIIKVCAASGKLSHAQTYVSKCEQAKVDDLTLAQLKSVSGLVFLSSESFKSAAHKFIESAHLIGSSFTDVISPEDACIYAILCALASFDRAELRTHLIENLPVNKNFVELVPNFRQILLDFYHCRYSACLSALNSYRSRFQLDINVAGSLINELYSKIRERALVLYTSPFISVSIASMADAFNCSVVTLEKELASLIMKDKIQARIDSHNKVLYARHTDRRVTTFKNALKMGEEYQTEMAAFILRTYLIQHDFIVEHQNKEASQTDAPGASASSS